MDIQSVRALKAEVLERLVHPLVAEAVASGRLGRAARSLRRVTGVEPGVALGIAGGGGGRDFRLAVRVQRRALDSDPTLRERVEALCKGEAEVRYIGRVSKSVGSPPVWHRARQRPLLVGCSIGHFRVTAGTLGAVAALRKSGRPVLLSNNHVLADEGLGKPGDAVLQPGVYDGGRARQDRVGSLLDFEPLKPGGANLVDAATAALDPGIEFDATTLTGLGRLAGLRAQPLEPGDAVAKVGRTTGVTRGVVTAIEVDEVVVDYEQGDFSFDRQIEIEGEGERSFSAGGDSGSLIVDREGRAAALLFAGSDQGGSRGRGLTYANDIGLVLQALDLTLAAA